jgi:hypothetical protein
VPAVTTGGRGCGPPRQSTASKAGQWWPR